MLGYDAFGNFIQVLPTWSADPQAGVIGAASGILTVSNNNTTAQVTATLGTHTDTQDVTISPRYTVGGSSAGIAGNVTLTNGADTVVVSANGAYQFPLLHPDSTPYDVQVQSQPANLACHPTNAVGVIAGANVGTADINCLSLFGGRVDMVPALTGIVATVAGSSVPGHADDAGLFAQFANPSGITTDGKYLYVADRNNHVIRRVEIATGNTITFAGQPGVSGHADGSGSTAVFHFPHMITTDGTNLYVTDEFNQVIRKIVIATRDVSTFAGQVAQSTPFQNGIGVAATFRFPRGITTDGTFLYVSELGNNVIRRIEIATANVTTLAGVPGSGAFVDGGPAVAQFNGPIGLDTDGTFLYVADSANHRIRRVDIATGNVITLAGNGSSGGMDNAIGTMATLNLPTGVVLLGGTLYVSEDGNNTLRTVNIGTTEVLLYAGTVGVGGLSNGPIASALFVGPFQMTADGTTLFLADKDNNVIRRID